MKNLKNLSFSLILSLVFVSSLSAQNWWKNGIRGEGPTVEKTINVASFEGVGLAFSGNVYLKQGNTQSVTVKGQQNIIDNILTEVDNGYWKIKFDRPVRKHEGINVYITVPDLNRVSISGSGNIRSDGKFTNLGDVYISVSGSGNLQFSMDAKSVETKISGSGNVGLDGSANDLSCQVSGSGNIDAYDLNANACTVKVSGSGNVKVYASSELNARISGSGDVFYKGSPRVSSKVSGSGDIRAR